MTSSADFSQGQLLENLKMFLTINGSWYHGSHCPSLSTNQCTKAPLKKGNHRKYQAMPTSDELWFFISWKGSEMSWYNSINELLVLHFIHCTKNEVSHYGFLQ